MEGSVAANGAAGAADAAAAGEGEGGENAGPDLNQLAQQFQSFEQSQEQMRGLVTQLAQQLEAPQGAEGEGDGEGDDGELDLSFLDDPALEPEQVAQHLQGLIDTRAQQIAQQTVGPLAERLDANERRAQLDALTTEVPEMADPQIAQQVIDATAQLADAYGWPDGLKSDPRMYRMVYLAAKATELANAEGDGTDAEVATLEGGGGARAAALAQQAQDMGDQIVGARRGRSALPFG